MGDFRELIPLPSKDTLVLDRYVGDWWFGINGGTNVSFYFSKLRMPLTYSVFDTLIPTPDSLINFPSGFGIGYYIGLYGEWMPRDSKWGASLSLFLQDFRSGRAQTSPSADTMKEAYEAITDFNYISISPSARYNLPVSGLYLMGGPDFDITMTWKLTNRFLFVNTGNINQDKANVMSPTKFRFGIHAGIGYEFLVADIKHKFRVLFNPYITLNGGTSLISDYGSSRNTIFARIGVAIKVGPDEVKKDTLQYNPNFHPPPESYATARHEKGPDFPGFIIPLLALEAKPVERPKVSEEVAEASTIDTKIGVPENTAPSRKITIRAGARRTFDFPSSASTTLSNDVKDYLDAVSEFLKDNPNSTVRIVGHSDDQGTFSQNQKRSEERARQVVQYLVSKGISTGRLFPRGDGARVPLGDNRTEDGRKKNRRVEIVIVQ
jgi:outer membrane protein OmpA-like peptidoglycan-associated protein